MGYRLVTFVIFGAILVGLAEWNLEQKKIEPLAELNDFWLEFCVGNAGERIRDPSVTVVRIHDDYEPLTIGEGDTPAAPEGAPPELSRLDYATMLGFAGKLGPRSVAFLPSPVFDENRVLNQTDIVPLKDAALQLPRMTLGSIVTADSAPAETSQQVPYPTLTVQGDASSVIAFTRTLRAPDPQLLANGDPAFTELTSAGEFSDDEAVRIPLVAREGDAIFPSLVLLATARHEGISLDQVEVDFTATPPTVRIGEAYTVPIAPDGTMEVPSHAGLRPAMKEVVTDEEGGASEHYHFATLTVDELAYTGNEEDPVAQRILASFQGKFDSVKENLVMIGFDRKIDRRIVTPAGETLSPTTLLARAVATIQSGRYIDLWPRWWRWGAIAAIGGLALLLFRLPRGQFIILGPVVALFYFAACVILFRYTLTWTPPFALFALFGLLLAIGVILPGPSERALPKQKEEEPAEGDVREQAAT